MRKPLKTTTADTIRSVVLIFLGMALFFLKQRYHGPMEELVRSYAGNFLVSFSVYFLASIACARAGQNKFSALMAALAAVEAFEITDGFGVMSNVFDPFDLLANAAGIAAAFAVEYLTSSKSSF